MPLDAETFDLLLGTVRRFVQQRLIPREAEVAENNAIPADILAEMRQLGLYGLAIPEAFGGLELNMEEEVRVVFELGQASPAFRLAIGTNIGIGSQGIVLAGTDEQKQKYLPKLASGELVGSFALSEPEAGSDAMAILTFADRDSDSYVINGSKRYITNAPVAGLFTLMARTNNSRHADAISCFLVEAGTPASRWAAPIRRWGNPARLPATSSSRIAGSRPLHCWGIRKARVPHRHAGAGQRPLAHRSFMRRHRRAPCPGVRTLCRRAQAVRATDCKLPTGAGND